MGLRSQGKQRGGLFFNEESHGGLPYGNVLHGWLLRSSFDYVYLNMDERGAPTSLSSNLLDNYGDPSWASVHQELITIGASLATAISTETRTLAIAPIRATAEGAAGHVVEASACANFALLAEIHGKRPE